MGSNSGAEAAHRLHSGPKLTLWETGHETQLMGSDPWEPLLPGSGMDVSAGGFLHHMSGISQLWPKVLLVSNGSGTTAMGVVVIRA